MSANLVIWITGASSGIGEALTYAFAKRGVKLIISARRAEELQRVKAACAGNPENIFILPIDLEFHQQASSWYEKAKNAFGTPDILINNGGIGHLGPALQMQNDVEHKVFNINFWGQVALTKVVLPDMMARGRGKIVIISSLLGHYGSANLAAYAGSKHALLGYFESVREEVKSTGVRFLLVSPGFVNTNVTLNSLTENGTAYNKNSVAQEKGMSPTKFAQKLIKKIDSNASYAYIGGLELFAIPFKRIAPRFFYALYSWMAAKAKKNN